MATALPSWTHLNDADVDALEPGPVTMTEAMQQDGIDLVGPVKMTATGTLASGSRSKAFSIGFIAFDEGQSIRFFDGDRGRFLSVAGRIKKTDEGLVIKTTSPIFGTVTLSKLELSDAPLFMPKQMAEEMTMPQFLAYLRGEDWKKV